MSKDKEIIHSIYVELDCLLDTRLGTLALVDDALMEKAINENYVVREEENFPPLDKNTFIELYNTRDIDVLKISPMTLCVDYVKDLAFTILKNSTASPIATGVRIVVNTYPYKLTDSEARDLIVSLAVLTNKFINISLIYNNMQELTPSYCRDNFNSMFMYQYDAWLDTHAKLDNFKNVNVTKLMLYGPRIYFNRKPTFEEKRSFEKRKIDPFTYIEECTAAVIDLTLLDIAIFSVDITKYIDKTKPT